MITTPETPPAPQTFGERLREACDKRGISARALSREVGASQSTVQEWMRPRPGRRPIYPSLQMLARIKVALRVPSDWLIEPLTWQQSEK